MNPSATSAAPATPVVAAPTQSQPTGPMTPAAFASSVRAKFPTGAASDGRTYSSMSDAELTQRIVSKYPVYASQIQMPAVPVPKTIGTETADTMMAAGKKAVTDVTAGADKIQAGVREGNPVKAVTGLGEAGLGSAAAAVQAIFAPITSVMKAAGEAGSNIPGMGGLANSGPVSAALDKVNALGAALDAIAAKHPQIAKDLTDALTVVSAVVGPKGLPEAAGEATLSDVAKSSFNAAKDASASADALGAKIGAKSEALATKIGESAPMKTAVAGAKGVKDAVLELPGKAFGAVKSGVSAAVKPAASALAEGDTVGSATARSFIDKQAAKADLALQPPVVQKAVAAKIPQPVATFVHGLSTQEKTTAMKMLDLQEEGMKNLSSKNRPESLIGQNVLDRVKAIADANKKAGEGTQGAVSAIADKPVNYEGTAKTFMDHLDTLGIHPAEDGKLDFSGSQFDGPASAKNRNFLQAAYEKLSPAADGSYVKSAKELHIGRQSLFQTIKDQPSADPFAGEATMAVNTARKGLLKDISSQGGEAGTAYRGNATTYATTEKTLQDFYKLIGKKWAGKPEDALSLKAGEVANRLKGNASADVNEIFARLEQVARDSGFKSSTSLANLADFNAILKEIVGDTQTNGFAGGIERGTRAGGSAAANAAGHVMDTLAHPISAVGKAGQAAMKFTNSNARNEAIRALRKLLASERVRTLEQGAPDVTPTVDETGGHIDLSKKGFQEGTPF